MKRICFVAAIMVAAVNAAAAPPRPDSTRTIRGESEGTALGKMTIEGEDRFRIDFERPLLEVTLDPATAPGLDWDDTWRVLEEGRIDLSGPLLAASADWGSPYLPRPWLDMYAHGEIVRFRPSLDGVESWRLTIADSRRGEVRTYEGKGNPPGTIGWDGRSADGEPMPPGYTYSYVVEAWDRAGNRRNFVGKGFSLPAYRIEDDRGLVFLFSGERVEQGAGDIPPEVLEAASRINQEESGGGIVEIVVTARTFDQAGTMAESIANSLRALLLGSPARIRHIAEVKSDAPEAGTVSISLAPAV